jgi:hypothetical protein
MNIPTKFGWNWLSGFSEEVKKVKVYGWLRLTPNDDNNWHESFGQVSYKYIQTFPNTTIQQYSPGKPHGTG